MAQTVELSAKPAVSLARNGADLRAGLFATARHEAEDEAAIRALFD